MSNKTKIICILLLFYLLSQNIMVNQAYDDTEVLIFGDENCKKCIEYISELRGDLYKSGILRIKIKYYRENVEARKDLHEIHEKFNIPLTMRGSVVTIIDDKFIFEGYIPAAIITDFLAEHKSEYQSFVLYKNEGENNYKLIDENGEIKDCRIIHSIIECEDASSKSRSSNNYTLSLVLIFVFGTLIFGVILYKRMKKEKHQRSEIRKSHISIDTRPHRFKKKKTRNYQK